MTSMRCVGACETLVIGVRELRLPDDETHGKSWVKALVEWVGLLFVDFDSRDLDMLIYILYRMCEKDGDAK